MSIFQCPANCSGDFFSIVRFLWRYQVTRNELVQVLLPDFHTDNRDYSSASSLASAAHSLCGGRSWHLADRRIISSRLMFGGILTHLVGQDLQALMVELLSVLLRPIPAFAMDGAIASGLIELGPSGAHGGTTCSTGFDSQRTMEAQRTVRRPAFWIYAQCVEWPLHQGCDT